MSAKGVNIWLEGAKFVPGWLAFAYSVFAGFARWRKRRHLRAVGPADEIRQALTTARDLLDDVVDSKPATIMYETHPRLRGGLRRSAQELEDLTGRFKDRQLCQRLEQVHSSCSAAALLVPGIPAPHRKSDDPEELERQRLDRLAEMRQHGIEGLAAIQAAFTRVNQLQHKTIGGP